LGIVIVVIIVIDEAHLVLHMGGIIAQTGYLSRVFYAENKIAGPIQDVHEKSETNGGYRCKAGVRFGKGMSLFIPMKVLYSSFGSNPLHSKRRIK